MKAPMQVRTQLVLQLSFDCVLLTLATADAAATYWSQTNIYIGTAVVFILCTMKTKPLGFFLYLQGFLRLVFHLEDFTSLSSDLPDALSCAPITHDATHLFAALLSHRWLSGGTFRGCPHCFLRLHVMQRCLNRTSIRFIKHRPNSRALPHLLQSLSYSWSYLR